MAKPAKQDSKPDTSATRASIRNQAEREILNRYKDEFTNLLRTKYEEAGLKYRATLTPEQRAQRQAEEKRERALAKARALLAENPDLLTELQKETEQEQGEPTQG